MIRIIFALLFLLLSVISDPSYADGFDNFGDYQRLEGKTIFASGNVGGLFRGRISPGNSSQFGRKDETVFKIGQFCFASSEDVLDKAGLLFIDKYSDVSIAIFSTSISSISVKITSATLIDCAQQMKRDADDDLARFKRQIEADRKKNEAMLEMLKKQEQSLKRSR